MTDTAHDTLTDAEDLIETQGHVRQVARGGALNIVGSIIYGVASFLLLVVLTRELGATRAGSVIVVIAVFTVMSRFAELGGSTGLVRMISRDRALGRQERIRPTVIASVVPVLALGVLFSIVLWYSAAGLARLFSGGEDTKLITDLIRLLTPFLPFSAAYSVLVLGSRGFGTMKVQVWVEKIIRACAMPIAAYLAVAVGGGPVAVMVSWALTTFVAAVVTVYIYIRLIRAEERGLPAKSDRPPAPFIAIARSFWIFTLPRAFGQAFNVVVLWVDTLFVSALIGATAGGIYAAGTRYLLVGAFIAEAFMQAVGPKVSGLLTVGRVNDAKKVVAQTTTWQVAIIWPTYLIVGSFAAVLLRVFGPAYVQAEAALVFLSIGIMLACLGGPCDSVILMSGRSRQSLFNSTAALTVNVVGNLILVPKYGIGAAGFVWALTLIVADGLPALQASRRMGIHPWSMPMLRTIALSLGTVGVACLGARVAFGDSWTGLFVATIVGGAAYSGLTWRLRRSIHLQELLDSFRREPPRVIVAPSPT
jgi:O-antigen/teichoic acid export membrane protein